MSSSQISKLKDVSLGTNKINNKAIKLALNGSVLFVCFRLFLEQNTF